MVLIFIILYRDSVVSTLRTICALKGFALAARPSGKLKAVVQAFSAFVIIILLIPYSLDYLAVVSSVAIGAIGGWAITSGFNWLSEKFKAKPPVLTQEEIEQKEKIDRIMLVLKKIHANPKNQKDREEIKDTLQSNCRTE